ncbi:MAG: hypothetical protein ABH886_00020 [Candidatus Desantisbacteria bacterium]
MPKKTSVSGVEIPPHEYGKVAKLLNEKLRFPMNQHTIEVSPLFALDKDEFVQRIVGKEIKIQAEGLYFES